MRARPEAIARCRGGEVFVTYQGRRPFADTLGDPAERIAAMARWGISRQVVSLSSLFGVECLPAAEAGAADPHLLAQQVLVLFEGGTSLATSMNDTAPLVHARTAAAQLIDAACV